MSYSVLNLKADLTATLHGTQLNQIQNIDGLIDRAARTLLLDIDPQETKRVQEFSTPIFNSVYDYAIASDVKGNRLIDIRPQGNRYTRDLWTQAYNQAFDIAKTNIYVMSDMFTINFNTGIKTIRINAPLLRVPTILSYGDNLTNNGTWTASGTATGLTIDNINFVLGTGAMSFNTTVGSAYVTNSTLTAVDLSAVANQSSLFAWVYIPTGTNLSLVELRWGSSASNYYSVTVSKNQQNNSFVNGWNLCQFDWANASTTGTPDTTKINYLRLALGTIGTNYGVKVNGFTSILGTILEYEYYSKYIFRDATTGAFQETVTDDSNLINLDTESYNLLFNLVAFLAAQQQQGLDAMFYDGNFFGQQYQAGIQRYKNLYKSEAQKPQSTYYYKPRRGYGRYIGRNWN